MAGLGRVNKERRRSGAGEGGGNLAADVPGFTHAHHHHFAAAFGDQLAGAGKVCIDVLIELGQPVTLNLQHFFACLLKIKARLQLNVRHAHSHRSYPSSLKLQRRYHSSR
ncbi:hypothetical protein D3C72_1875600 [compost metagenome]